MEDELQILKEACQALARLDADRLEELAATCRVLNRELPSAGSERARVAQSMGYGKPLRDLGRMVEKTRENLHVIRRVHLQSRDAHALDIFPGAGLR